MELTKHLRVDSVSRLELGQPWLVEVDASLEEAVRRMREWQTGCLLVVDQSEIVGIFTERDLLTRVLAVGRPLTSPISEVMTSPPVCVELKEPLQLALEKMQTGRYRHLPVVDEANRPVGVLSVKRVMRYFVEHFPNTIYNQPPNPHQYPSSRWGA